MGMGYELNAIAATVVGGCSLQGGVGLIPGVILGVVFLRVVIDAVAKILESRSTDWTGLIVGILVVLAVAFNELRRGSGSGRKQWFPGALGWIVIPFVSVIAGLVAMISDKDHGLCPRSSWARSSWFCGSPQVGRIATTHGRKLIRVQVNQPTTFDAKAELFVDLRPLVVFLVLGELFWLLMNRTVIGRHLYAMGGNVRGRSSERDQYGPPEVAGLLDCSITDFDRGVLYAAKVSTCKPSTMAVGYELNAIAAAVVGGCGLQGGTGLIPGVMLGVLFLQNRGRCGGKIVKSGSDDWKGLIVGFSLCWLWLSMRFAAAADPVRSGCYPALLGG